MKTFNYFINVNKLTLINDNLIDKEVSSEGFAADTNKELICSKML